MTILLPLLAFATVSLLVVAGATQSRAGEGDVLGLLIGGAVLGTLLGSSFSGGLYDTTPYYRAERRHRHHRRHHHSRHAAPAYRSYDAPTYVSYDAPAYAPAYLPSPDADPAVLVENTDWHDDATSRMREALTTLDERSRDILESRWLTEDKQTLHELADQYGVSAERIRQIEATAIKKLGVAMA